MTRQLRAIVRGRVHGVYFRATTEQEANRLGLAGYARNLPDGTVEVVARGGEEALKLLIEYLHRGPTAARVKAVEVDWSNTNPAPDPFTIKA